MPLQLLAQNLDQTVSITNSFKTQALSVQKQEALIQVPDSLLTFDYKFNYSVFDAPYKGAYEFSPYQVSVNPETTADPLSTFCLKAGAGYSLHPVLDFVWTPIKKGNAGLSVHQNFKGYYGRYRVVSTALDKSALYTLKGQRYNGYDFDENFGVDFRFSGKKSEFTAAADYNGLFEDWSGESTNLNRLAIEARLRSVANAKRSFIYDVKLHLSTLGDYLHSPKYMKPMGLTENKAMLSGSLGPNFKLDKGRVLIDFQGVALSHKSIGSYSGSSFCWNLVPHYDIRLWVFNFKLGARLGSAGRFYIRPDVELRVPIAGRALEFDAAVTGGVRPQDYYSLKSQNHRYTPRYNTELKHSADNWDIRAGIRGSVAGHLQYKLEGGYQDIVSDPFWSVKVESEKLTPSLSYCSSKQLYAKLLLYWLSEHVDAALDFNYRNTRGLEGTGAVPAAPLSGQIRVTGNLRHRIFAGVSLNAANARKITLPENEMAIQGYLDLGVHAEYRMSRAVSFWIRGGNLLNEAVQNVPFMVEEGINFTGGIILKLQ